MGNIAPFGLKICLGPYGALPVLGLLELWRICRLLGGHMAGRPETGRQLTRWIWGEQGILLAVFQLVYCDFWSGLIERMDIPFYDGKGCTGARSL